MNRRLFLARLGSLTVTAGTSGVLGLALSGCGGGGSKPVFIVPAQIPAALQLELAHLVDDDFGEYAAQSDGLELYLDLLAKGVVSDQGEYFEERLTALAQAESMLEYNAFYYTETELQLYALAYLLS